MILGLGADVCDIERFAGVVERAGASFFERTFAPRERLEIDASVEEVAALAQRFAAKEACAKALGSGFDGRLRWTNIETQRGGGAVTLRLTNVALRRLRRMTPVDCVAVLHVTVSRVTTFAHALVMIEGRFLPHGRH